MHVEEVNDTNCKTYLLVGGAARAEAALVDPVRERVDTYRALLAGRGLTLRWILETHTHADHSMLNRAARSTRSAASSSCTGLDVEPVEVREGF
jgi:glyoxylase-like metal-dependent hydrolase (beta-lactamase superfamily II)